MALCTFCEIIDRKLPAYIIDEDDAVITFLSPENHPLIVTKEHIPDIFALESEIASRIMRTAVRVARATKAATACGGIYVTQINGSAAGQDVFHYHMHIYPKWKDGRTPDTSPAARRKMTERTRNKLEPY